MTDIQALFERIAPLYDRLNDQLSFGLHHVWKQMAVDWLELPAGATALDLCCGTGDLTRMLARRVGQQGRVVGLDFAAAPLAIARQRSCHYPQIEWLQGDALAVPFADQTFQGITMGYGLRNVVDIRQALREIFRLLIPAGRVAILDFSHPQTPALQQFQQWYLQQWVVPTARQYGLAAEYDYLWPSIQAFPSPATLCDLIQNVGFQHVKHYPLLGGLMAITVAQK
ncbi:bifunctional demethylmenaquinone methyltransferase/2-methoxy-6-polyprenyl-1,4-benzoquinol methylase UbiE [Thermosynechococcus sp. JY1334]|uniref:bifunctional demethylmenaquinone methyltransferase/2-methoxy-6-polyprenyl-1,4-benzoquinol methylase UbiE n=1 Tax=unclassified Thermosynechococcus TaxID=2622553 RepID=UPI002670E36E|nr:MULTISPECIES: bifunctional demethylmenaquinone methyltransferase/2-methoxy-6-polyprenyl-1,4-benzoquinol methylase UbiE [unclassified Thermosynechococcus]MDR7897702.1 bifunctional demethylmenaquinone methyltransferase/2-methoxy-6-polyprenyl-1,4-benzoquinol methylase UbiE [Thermosynechococcus sp. JY1332]MDR7905100.1 bifunctional demethylmenaquinone methyltransferase/2-methoxy-6-polyprenyl-1,4-benzoquinol methylase UbiE [Thermosynechococcus sp. JY1334]MDR7992926.1 bifunctional demethylmenaquinon